MIKLNSKLFNFRTCYPSLKGELEQLFDRYPYKIDINVNNLEIADTYIMEEWCTEYYGELNEYAPDSPWQVSHQYIHPDQEIISFHFWSEKEAFAFKMRWL